MKEYEVTKFCNNSDNVIRSGGYGKVYKVLLGNGQHVLKNLGWGEVKGDALHDIKFRAKVQV
jgi:hypothetical protein